MSEDELSDTPAGNTRHRLASLGRRSFTPLTDRMRRYQSGSSENLAGDPVKSSRSPGKQRKNHSNKSSGSPKTRGRTPKQLKNKLYPNLDKDRGLYPNLSGNDSDFDFNDVTESDDNEDADIEDEEENLDDSSDSLRRKQIKRDTGKYGRKQESGEFRDSPYIRGRRPAEKPDSHRRWRDDINAQKQTDKLSILILIMGIFAIVFGLVKFLNQEEPKSGSSPSDDYYKLFKPNLDQIKAKYPSQSVRFWRVVNSSIRRLLTEKYETYPAVLMFGIPEMGSETGTCISKDIINSLNNFFNSSVNGYINSGSLNSESPEKMKLDLDEKLQKNLDNGKGLVLDHIENLPARTALLLHGYCDGDNAPYKSAAIILGLHVSSGKQLRDQDHVIESILNELWEEELGVDEMPALRSRIANSVAVVNPEKVVKC